VRKYATPKEFLETVGQLVTGDRAEEHGDFDLLHEKIAFLWQSYLGTAITPKDVVQMMIHVKQARDKLSPGNDDNDLDIAGYASFLPFVRR
jgi:hypothetical protein